LYFSAHGNVTAQFAYARTVLSWFLKRRGLALALVLAGSGVGSILIPPLTQWTIEHHGWRSAYLMLGGIALLGIPLTALLVRNRPDAIVVADHSAGSSTTVAAALRSGPFWILAFITMLSEYVALSRWGTISRSLIEPGSSLSLPPQG
jgi:predicted MFS family arabinose efflux permease